MAKIKMLKDAKGSNDGATVHSFAEGEVYDVSDELALCFIDDKVAEEVKGKSKAPVSLPGAKSPSQEDAE